MDNYQPYFDVAALIAKHLRGELTDHEKNELEQWLQSDPRNPELFRKLTDDNLVIDELDFFSVTEKDKAWENITEKTGFKKRDKKQRLNHLLPYAAAILLLIGVCITAARLLHKKEERETLAIHPKDLLPGGNKAVLTLANGSKIVLDDTKQGKIAKQQNVVIDKTQSGQLVYTVEDAIKNSGKPLAANLVAFNTIATPRGGQYEVVLPDGTKVWLNAASSLKYPTTFTGSERRVELTGEAYFEVAKNAARPFFVTSGGQTVEVLGTHFNINSYFDEKAIKTTLLEGSIKVSDGINKAVIKPGQQSIIQSPDNHRDNNSIIIREADTEEAIAWKNGKFLFNYTDLQTIMRELSRWYDVDVEYQGTIAPKHYSGHISRNVPVSQLFQVLKTSGINFTINGRKIIVRS
jgi:transmembrane sensor